MKHATDRSLAILVVLWLLKGTAWAEHRTAEEPMRSTVARNSQSPDHAISLALGVMTGQGAVAVETRLSEILSVVGRVGMGMRSSDPSYRGALQMRCYLSPGLHLGVDTGYVIRASAEDVNGGETASQAQGITVGNRLGYKWISDQGFTAQAQVGFEWLMVVSSERSHGRVYNTDLYPVFNINTGWSF